MYALTALPLLAVGACHESAAAPLPATAVTAVGGPGAPTAMVPVCSDCRPTPWALIPATVKLYCLPFVSPGTDADRAEPEFTVTMCAESSVLPTYGETR